MSCVFIKHKKDKETTSVRCHYLTTKDGKNAQCKRCTSVLKTLGGSTKGLHTHLSSKHGIKVLNDVNHLSKSQGDQELTTQQPPTKRKLVDYFSTFKNDTLDEVLARMTALDGLAFRTFISSSDLRKLLIAKYGDLPTSAVSIRKRVIITL